MLVFQNLIFKIVEGKSLRCVWPLLHFLLPFFTTLSVHVGQKVYFCCLWNSVTLLYWPLERSISAALLRLSQRLYAQFHVQLFRCHCVRSCEEHQLIFFDFTFALVFDALPNVAACSFHLLLFWVLIALRPHAFLLQHLNNSCTVLLLLHRKLWSYYEVIRFWPIPLLAVLILYCLMCSELIDIKL